MPGTLWYPQLCSSSSLQEQLGVSFQTGASSTLVAASTSVLVSQFQQEGFCTSPVNNSVSECPEFGE